VKQEASPIEESVNGPFSLPADDQATDLSYSVYGVKRDTSSAPLYRTNPDPYIGSSVHPPNSAPQGPSCINDMNGRENFDLKTQQQEAHYTVTTTSALADPNDFTSFLGNSDPARTPVSSENLPSSRNSRPRSSQASKQFDADCSQPLSNYRPPSEGPFSNSSRNSVPEMRSSPVVSQAVNLPGGRSISSPPSPKSHKAQSSDPVVTSVSSFSSSNFDFSSTSSAFKPPSNNFGHHNHPNYTNHSSPSSFHNGPSPPLPGQQNASHNSIHSPSTGMIVPHCYPPVDNGFDYDAGYNGCRRRPTSSGEGEQQRSSAPTPNENSSPADNEPAKRVIVPAGRNKPFENKTNLAKWSQFKSLVAVSLLVAKF